MNNLVIDGRVIAALEQLRDRLQGDPLARAGELPKYMHDGTQVKTLAQVQAVTGMSRFSSAVKVIQAEEAPAALYYEAVSALKNVHSGLGGGTVRHGVGTRRMRLRIVERAGAILERRRRREERRRRRLGIKALYGQPESDFQGIAIMLGLSSKRVAEHLAVPGGLKPEQLHVTVAYYGSMKDATFNEKTYIELTQKVAEDFEPFRATLNGISRFTAPGSDSKDPIVVNVDSPALEKIRNRVVAMCGEPKSEHGFTPHMTLAFIDQDDDNPIRRYPIREARFDHLIVGWGSKHTKIMLGEKKDED